MNSSQQNEAKALLDVRNLRVAFSEQEAVRGISFTIAPGETLALVGESGSGKSATSLAIMRLLPETAKISGFIRLEDEDLLTLSAVDMRSRRGSSVAMIFQEPMTALNPMMSIGRQIAGAVTAHTKGMPRASLRERVTEAMREVGLPEERMDDYPHQFSGGQLQRVLIAMAIVNTPQLLIADEPTTALDVTVQEQILDLLKRLRETRGLSMLFISHDLAVVSQVADRVAVMQKGLIVEQGSAADIFERPQHPYTRGLLAAAPTMRTDREKPLATIG
jgi:peptide/nickel transport system ATP-binding protein